MAGGTAVLLAEVVFRVLEPWPLKVTIPVAPWAASLALFFVSAQISGTSRVASDRSAWVGAGMNMAMGEPAREEPPSADAA